MNKELKLLLVSMLLLILGAGYMYWKQNYTCIEQGYQDLSSSHSRMVCNTNKQQTCWDKYPTENQAILNCEGNK